jgi:hypothetical protein
MASQPFADVQIQANNAYFCPRLLVRVRRRSPRLASGLASNGNDHELPAASIAAVSVVATAHLSTETCAGFDPADEVRLSLADAHLYTRPLDLVIFLKALTVTTASTARRL